MTKQKNRSNDSLYMPHPPSFNASLLTLSPDSVTLGLGSHAKVFEAEYFAMPVAVKVYNSLDSLQFMHESTFY